MKAVQPDIEIACRKINSFWLLLNIGKIFNNPNEDDLRLNFYYRSEKMFTIDIPAKSNSIVIK